MKNIHETKLPTAKNGAELLIECLRAEQVDTIFGYPGGAVIPIYDALYDCLEIHHILTRHEQAAVHAADGYARVTGQAGVALVTSGPGATNAVTGIANAYMDSVPMVVLTGQVSTDLIGRDSFQEVNIYGMTMDVTKHNYSVMDIRDLPRIVKEAFHLAVTGRPGPVLIDLPKNIMTARTDQRPAIEVHIRGYEPQSEISEEAVRLIAGKIESSRRPVLVVGGGAAASGAAEQLRQLAETAQIPVATTLMGIGAFPSRHPLYLGMLGMHGTYAANRAVHHADLLICLGTRLNDRLSGNAKSFAPNAWKIHVDIDDAELDKNIPVELKLCGDIGKLLRRLNAYVKGPEKTDWPEETAGWQRKVPHYSDEAAGSLNPQEVIRLIDKHTQGNAVVATDVGQHQIWTAHHYRFSRPRSFLTSGGLGTMGFGFPAAIGAAIALGGPAAPPVVCITGDGSFQMNLQEMMTAVDYGLPVKIAILNNGYLGMVRQWQQLFYERRYSSVHITSPDFVAFAGAYGVPGLRAQTPEEADAIIQQALALPGPVLMEFNVREEQNVYPMVPPGAGNDQMLTGDGEN
ncbi:biosynthetic-type acetolactate synthase large subunit [Paenibacillus timonensis]|jgi:acetolactate synthase I/II/III large subunit|uniref:biosynthetic-type acetolactate synthase large subunit n=1 Tax=Paenibacillus sp. J53TS2 TaxID=2807197 RepID=UPI0012D95489|nr:MULTISPECIES: biosynthetic-type acetolactate synthase large subunit [Paenibacillus]MUG87484.1 biosynthetic-type acetolactate synthase large subunit [Paenibacillus timonensis]GIP47120.1 acetolactate synthase [Paenibacillus sp. J53TS2]